MRVVKANGVIVKTFRSDEETEAMDGVKPNTILMCEYNPEIDEGTMVIVDGDEMSFQDAAMPLMVHLATKHHPHKKAIVESNTAELLETHIFHKDDEHIVD